MGAERLQKLLSQAGIASRRASEELIIQGRVTVDGKVATLGDKADPKTQIVAVDGERIKVNTDLVYLAFNKPVGVVTTADDPQGRPTVMDFMPPKPRVYPVGRLDMDTSGLLLLTNDGEFANRITHPRYHVEKTYMCQIRGPVPKPAIRDLLAGVELDDGLATAVKAQVRIADQTRSLVEIVINEGRNRQVRRMMAAVNLPLEALVRTKIGPVHLGNMGQGKTRLLNSQELGALYAQVGMGAA
ncbi:pseudouridine synthase [Stomatohabitans albus]|uniref:pseudouridine synthase n=1 Tax=Stomatohabitans albus TaxID=3110766 RepID=UPI00300D4E7F